MDHKGTKYLTTERLILRKFEMSDAEAMFKNWANDEEVTRFLTWPPHADVSVTEGVLKEWVGHYGKPDYYQWAIVLKEDGNEPIGSIGVVLQNEKAEMAHIGYCIARRLWRRGITSEALQAVMDYLFDEVRYGCIQARHDPRNLGSGKVMEKCGMRYEGTLRHMDWNNQGICDASYYSVLRKERGEKILIKPHHFMDIVKLYGAGVHPFVPDEAFQHDFYRVANKIVEDLDVSLRLTIAGDDICKPCNRYDGMRCTDPLDMMEGYCEKELYNRELDSRIIQLLRLDIHAPYSARELLEKMAGQEELIFLVWKEEPEALTKRRNALFRAGCEKLLK